MSQEQLFVLILSIGVCEVVGITSGLFTAKSVTTWYKKLKKPSFNPPNAIFGPVWTLLYALMGISLYLVLTSGRETDQPLALFVAQLTLNFFWSIIFFSWRRLTFALIEIVVLLVMIILTIFAFWPINHIASLLLVPYVLWVTFATILTYSIARLNN